MKISKTLPVLALAFLLSFFSTAQSKIKSTYIEGNNCVIVMEGAKASTAQACPCVDKHPVFNIPSNISPKKLRRLGSFPQFGNLEKYPTVDDFMTHFKSLYAESKNGNAQELDKLFVAMGYTGFNDPRFTASRVTIDYLPAGSTGMTGNGRHHYTYATISEGLDIKLKGFRIASFNSCDVTIMETCGNASWFGTCKEGTTEYGTTNKKICPIDLKSTGIPNPVASYSFVRHDSVFVRVCETLPTSLKDDKKPTLVNSLSHNQQFGNMVDVKTPQEFCDRLLKLYKENKKGNAAELDRLMKSIGYDEGLKDKRFTANSVSIVKYDGGVVALMGNGNHEYMNSSVSDPSWDSLRGFNIKSLNTNCDVGFIDVCGNALFCPQPMKCKTIYIDCSK